MNNKKSIFPAIVALLLSAGVLGYLDANRLKSLNTSTGKPTNISNTNTTIDTDKFLIEGYPIDTVPLYKMTKINSSKFFVNTDPARTENYFGKKVNYFNIVFTTESDAQDTFTYYRSLMSEQNNDSMPSDQLQGKIGKYKVSVSQYPDNKEVYLQVYLPTEEIQTSNRYFQDYPRIIERDKAWIEYESSYGLLNQKGGQIEFTQYFPLPKEEKDRNEIITTYHNKYQSETDFNFNDKSGMMTWKKDDYSISMTFSKNHGRIYLMIRKTIR